jgi:hypothetical protein
MSKKSLSYEIRTEEQEALDERNRRDALLRLIAIVHRQRLGTVALVQLVDTVGLERQLDDLVDGDPQRHRRITAARRLVRMRQDQAVAELGLETSRSSNR